MQPSQQKHKGGTKCKNLHSLTTTSCHVSQCEHGGADLGVSISSAYELMHETGFRAVVDRQRIVVPKEKFRRWVDAQTGGDA